MRRPDRPACGRPVRVGGRCRRGAGGADDGSAGDAGARRWGRSARPEAPRRAGEPAAERGRGRALPRPASRTRVPFPRHRAPARGASAWSVGGSSARGTCVRKARVGVGRNGRDEHRPSRADSALLRGKCAPELQRILQEGLSASRAPARPGTTSRRRLFTPGSRAGIESASALSRWPIWRSVRHERPARRHRGARGHRVHASPPCRRSPRPITRARPTTTTATTAICRWSPVTAARAATCPSTRSRATSSRSRWAPTTSSRTWSQPRTAT